MEFQEVRSGILGYSHEGTGMGRVSDDSKSVIPQEKVTSPRLFESKHTSYKKRPLKNTPSRTTVINCRKRNEIRHDRRIRWFYLWHLGSYFHVFFIPKTPQPSYVRHQNLKHSPSSCHPSQPIFLLVTSSNVHKLSCPKVHNCNRVS